MCIGEVVELDLTYNYVMFGKTVLKQMWGVTQGSPLAVFEAILTACYMAHLNLHGLIKLILVDLAFQEGLSSMESCSL